MFPENTGMGRASAWNLRVDDETKGLLSGGLQSCLEGFAVALMGSPGCGHGVDLRRAGQRPSCLGPSAAHFTRGSDACPWLGCVRAGVFCPGWCGSVA